MISKPTTKEFRFALFISVIFSILYIGFSIVLFTTFTDFSANDLKSMPFQFNVGGETYNVIQTETPKEIKGFSALASFIKDPSLYLSYKWGEILLVFCLVFAANLAKVRQ